MKRRTIGPIWKDLVLWWLWCRHWGRNSERLQETKLSPVAVFVYNSSVPWNSWTDVIPSLNERRFRVCHFLDNYPQSALNVKDRSIFDGREGKWYFSYDFECVTEFLGKDFKSKAQNYPIYQILSWSTEKQWREDMIPLFLMSWHIENDDYDIIPSNWRWRHQTF